VHSLGFRWKQFPKDSEFADRMWETVTAFPMSEPDSPTPSIDQLENAEIRNLTPQNAFELLSAYSDNMGSLRKLSEQIRESGIIPFVGAGISVPFGMPGWEGFLKGEAAKCGLVAEVAALLKENQYEEAAELLLERRGHTAFRDEIDDAFGSHKFEGKPLNGAIAHLPRIRHQRSRTRNTPIQAMIFAVLESSHVQGQDHFFDLFALSCG
jgi:hypothetical protein